MKEAVMEEQIKSRRVAVVFVVIVGLLLSLYLAKFRENIFWQETSQSLVVGRMYQVQHGLDTNPAGFLTDYWNDGERANNYLIFLNDEDVSQYTTNIYFQQVGLQGDVFAALNLLMCMVHISPAYRLAILYFITAACFVAVVTGGCLWLAKQFGTLCSMVSAFCLFGASWMLRSAYNLYWVTWTMLLPMVLSAWLCQKHEENKIKACWISAGVFAAILLKCCCGYEFITTVMLACEVPVLYYFLKADKQNRRHWFYIAFQIGIAALLAFGVSLFIWAMQMRIFTGSWQQSLLEMQTVAYRRTGMGAIPQGTLVAEDINSLAVSRWEVLKIYVTCGDVLGQGWTVLNLVIAEAIGAIAVGALAWIKEEKAALQENLLFLGVSAFGFIASASWFVIASGHSILHQHIDYILWFFPFLPLCVGHIAYAAKYVFCTAAGWGLSLNEMKRCD